MRVAAARPAAAAAALVLMLAVVPARLGAENGRQFRTVVVDAGHGGDDHGAKGRNGLLEKAVVLDVAQRLGAALEERGLRVVMTRSEDQFVSLDDRTRLANDAEGQLFVSIHANASRLRGVHGIETFFASPEATDEAARELAESENLAFGRTATAAAPDDPLQAILGDLVATEHEHDAQEFARITQERVAKAVGARSRGVKQAPFVVLMGVRMPAVLVEIGFLTNAGDEQALAGAPERARLALELAEAVEVFRDRYDARLAEGADVPAEGRSGR